MNALEAQLTLKEKADYIMESPGKVSGVIFDTNKRYIISKEGAEAISAIERKSAELGYPIVFADIKPFNYYPEGLGELLFLLCKEIFKWDDSEFFKMGYAAPAYSIIITIALRYFIGIKALLKKSPIFWEKHHPGGKLTYSFDEKNKNVFIRVFYPSKTKFFCIFLKGYLLRCIGLTLESKKVRIEETKCTLFGDPFNEFKLYWE